MKKHLGRWFRGGFAEFLAQAGIEINGPDSWDIVIRDEAVFADTIFLGTLGLGNAYVAGCWDCDDLEEFFHRVLLVGKRPYLNWLSFLHACRSLIVNQQNRLRSYRVAQHYDISPELYELMLGPSMVYTCADWSKATTLEEAQEAKLRQTCEALDLRRGMTLLDIGCGWGSLAEYAARNYGVHVVGLTISEEQAAYARTRCQGLTVEVVVQDYREYASSCGECFDRIVSVGMFEQVGPRNYSTYMKVVYDLLDHGGVFLLHTIGSHTPSLCTDLWLERHIFPGSVLPTRSQINRAAQGMFELVRDISYPSEYYAQTLRAWCANFENAWPRLAGSYDEKFYRLWRYYLLMCAGSFTADYNQLLRFVFKRI